MWEFLERFWRREEQADEVLATLSKANVPETLEIELSRTDQRGVLVVGDNARSAIRGHFELGKGNICRELANTHRAVPSIIGITEALLLDTQSTFGRAPSPQFVDDTADLTEISSGRVTSTQVVHDTNDWTGGRLCTLQDIIELPTERVRRAAVDAMNWSSRDRDPKLANLAPHEITAGIAAIRRTTRASLAEAAADEAIAGGLPVWALFGEGEPGFIFSEYVARRLTGRCRFNGFLTDPDYFAQSVTDELMCRVAGIPKLTPLPIQPEQREESARRATDILTQTGPDFAVGIIIALRAYGVTPGTPPNRLPEELTKLPIEVFGVAGRAFRGKLEPSIWLPLDPEKLVENTQERIKAIDPLSDTRFACRVASIYWEKLTVAVDLQKSKAEETVAFAGKIHEDVEERKMDVATDGPPSLSQIDPLKAALLVRSALEFVKLEERARTDSPGLIEWVEEARRQQERDRGASAQGAAVELNKKRNGPPKQKK